MLKKLYCFLVRCKDKASYAIRLRKGIKTAYLFGGPTHGNLGDSAIFIAESDFLMGLKQTVCPIFWSEYDYYGKAIRVTLLPWDAICLHGGGNMGDVWFNEEILRRCFLMDNRHRELFFFPQTIHYTDTEDGQRRKQDSIPFYNRRNITLVAREKTSFLEMQEIYPKAKVLLTPDIVLSMPAQQFNKSRNGALLCMRRDVEKNLTQDNECNLRDVLREMGLKVAFTDTVIDAAITDQNRNTLVFKKMEELASAKIVITDRLHGMVFCALTGTPCIVLSNNNHKVKGTYDWISYLPYIKYANDVDEAIGFIPELLKMENCVYDNTPLQPYFDELRKAIR